MRTYSHALLTWTVADRKPSPGLAAAAVLGAVMPDTPMALGAAWLSLRRGEGFGRTELESEVCARTVFSGPDAALHSVIPVGAALALGAVVGGTKGRGDTPLAFLLGWSGHVVADALTHAGDARPIFWPLTGWRFRSPVSYWDRGRHARAFSLLEHAALALALRRRGASGS